MDKRKESRGTARGAGRGGVAQAVVALAMTFVFAEVVKACRSSFWAPFTPQEWAGVCVAACVYTVYFAVALTLGQFLTRRIHKRSGDGSRIVSGLVAAAVLWGILSYFQGRFSVSASAMLAALVAAWALGALISPRLLGLGAGAFDRLWCIVAPGAIGATVLAAEAFYITVPERAARASLGGMLWFAIALLVGSSVWALTRRSRRGLVVRLFTAMLILGLPFLLFHIHLWAGWKKQEDRGPSVVLITSDALRANYCSVYGGHVPTPNLERLAAEGVLFSRSYSLAPWTVPSVFSMFTSSYPPGLSTGGTKEEWRKEIGSYHVGADTPMLAELLAERGYATGAFVGNPLLSDRNGILRGFDVTAAYDAYSPLYTGPLAGTPYLQAVARRLNAAWAPLRPVDSSRLLTCFARGFMRKHRRGSFFLWVHFMDPHDPYNPPERYRSMDGPWPVFCPASHRWDSPRPDADGHLTFAPDEKPYTQHLYEGEIRYMDDCVGQLLGDMEGWGLDERTYVCFTSDHGEEFWDHGGFSHGQSMYNELVGVPLIVRAPDIAPGRVDTSVSAIDVMPTLAALAQQKPPDVWRGASLSPLLNQPGAEHPSRPCFAQATNRQAWPETYQMVAVGKWKLVRGNLADTTQLFDVMADPREQTNLTAGSAARVDQLTQLLDAWERSFPSIFGTDAVPVLEADQRQRMIREMRALGYVY